MTARAAASQMIDAVLRGKRTLDDAMGAALALRALEPRDRTFARALASAVLRRMGSLDAVLARCLDKGAPPKPLETVLRLGAAQLLILGTPAHAAVGETVELAPAKLRGLANAVLRRVAREGTALLAQIDVPRADTPDWLWSTLVASHGEARARAIAAAHGSEPPLDLTVKKDAELWAERLGAEILPTGTLRLREGQAVADLPGFEEGAWWVQDAAAALPARLRGDVAGARALDLCAAPGGKTLQLAAAGARVTALDQSAKRLDRLVENLARTGLEAEIVAADAGKWRPAEPFPFVLLDAPCTATGTLRRHPEIAHLKSEADAVKLVAAQDKLLDAAAAATAPGGTLVYSVCSLDASEGRARIAAFLERRPEFARAPIAPAEIGGQAALIDEAGDLSTSPAEDMDGFYAARLRRAPS
ncbi:MAG: RsmB/NOP family class I SAM-dependent RNA methyltransferase [Tagaea sp.]